MFKMQIANCIESMNELESSMCRPMPSKRLSFEIFRNMFRFHFISRASGLISLFLGSVSISWLGQQSLHLQIVPWLDLLKHVS